MSLPLWVHTGAKCVCKDDNWTDVFDLGTEGPFPEAGKKYTVSGAAELLGVWYLILSEQSVAPDYYAVSAFRPLSRLERDVALFDHAFKGVAARPARERERTS